MFDHNEIIFISGQRGSGKSYYAKRLSYSFPRCLIFDTLGEYAADLRFYDPQSLIDFLIEDSRDPQFFRIAFDYHDSESIFPLFSRICLAIRNVHITIEEVDLFSTPFKTDPAFSKLLKYGRHYGNQIIGVSRRPAEVSRTFTSQCNRFVIFEQHEPRDLLYWRSILGRNAELISKLPKHHFLNIDFSLHSPSFEIQKPVR